MTKIEAVGKNVEKAIEEGLKELGTTRDKVNIEVLDAGGLFKKARVLISIDEKTDENVGGLNKVNDEIDTATLLEENDAKIAEKVTDEVEIQEEKVEDKTDKINIDLSYTPTQNDDTLSVGTLKVKEFLMGYLKCAGVNAELEIVEDADAVRIDIVGIDANKIIGKHGDGLNALQYLCNIIANKADRNCGKIYIDTCGYKDEREQELIKLARKLKFTALREEKVVKLEPMSAYDRKIIHKALAEDDMVETYSEGEEPKRYIVIAPKSSDGVAHEDNKEETEE